MTVKLLLNECSCFLSLKIISMESRKPYFMFIENIRGSINEPAFAFLS